MATIKDLEAFGEGWNRHDVDFIMTFMSDDCVFETTAGKEVCGTRYAGRERVREAFARVFSTFPDANFADTRHFVAANRGVSEWIFTGTTTEGQDRRGQRLRHLHVRETTRSRSRARTSRTERHKPRVGASFQSLRPRYNASGAAATFSRSGRV